MNDLSMLCAPLWGTFSLILVHKKTIVASAYDVMSSVIPHIYLNCQSSDLPTRLSLSLYIANLVDEFKQYNYLD